MTRTYLGGSHLAVLPLPDPPNLLMCLLPLLHSFRFAFSYLRSTNNVARRSQGESEGARKNQNEPERARTSQEESGRARRSQEEPGRAGRSQEEPQGAMRSKEKPGGARKNQGGQQKPGGAREGQRIRTLDDRQRGSVGANVAMGPLLVI